jgi:MOSC domain-containing protein YiiM
MRSIVRRTGQGEEDKHRAEERTAPSDHIGEGRLHQINISDGGVPKLPVAEAIITMNGVSGDRQRNRAVHGGADRAVCLFSLERIEALREEGHVIYPGASGENLTLAGLDWSRVQPGDRLRIGERVELEFTSYTTPCRYNASWFRDADYGRISHKRHPGWSRLYARVRREGLVRQGDCVLWFRKSSSRQEAMA